MSNRRFTQFLDTLHKQPVLIDCNFVVDRANGNGLGIRSLKGAGIQAVYMNSSLSFVGDTHTSVLVDSIPDTSILSVGMQVQGSGIPAHTTIASIIDAVSINLSQAATATAADVTITYQAAGNPNPPAGYALIQLQDNYQYYIGGFSGFVVPTTSNTTSTTSGLSVGAAYVITVLGTTTLAEWQDIGVPIGQTPAVGLAFIATKTGTGGAHTGKVGLPSVSGISHIEVVGDPNTSIVSSQKSVGRLGGPSGASILVKMVGPSFTGSALGSHTHDFTVIGGQAASTTNDIANYAGPLLGKQEAANATYLGANSATNGGVVAASAGTPAGSLAFGAVAPTDNSVVGMAFYLSNSRITVNGY